MNNGNLVICKTSQFKSKLMANYNVYFINIDYKFFESGVSSVFYQQYDTTITQLQDSKEKRK